MFAFLTALLAVAKPLLDEIYFKSVIGYLNEYEENEKKIATALGLWPDIDDAAMSQYRKERIRLEEALRLQSVLIPVKQSV